MIQWSIPGMLLLGADVVCAQQPQRELNFTKSVEVSYFTDDPHLIPSLRGIDQVDYRYTLHVEQRRELLYSNGDLTSDIRYSYPMGVLDTSSYHPHHVRVAADSIWFYAPSGTIQFGIPNLIGSQDTSAADSLLSAYIVRPYFTPLTALFIRALQKDGYRIHENNDSVIHYSSDSATYFTQLKRGVCIYSYHPLGTTVHEEFSWYDTLAKGLLYPLVQMRRDVEYLGRDTCIEKVKLETYSQFSLIEHARDTADMPSVYRSDEQKHDQRPYAFQVANRYAVAVFHVPTELLARTTYSLCDMYGKVIQDRLAFDPGTNHFLLPEGLRYGIYLLRPMTNDLPAFQFLFYKR